MLIGWCGFVCVGFAGSVGGGGFSLLESTRLLSGK